MYISNRINIISVFLLICVKLSAQYSENFVQNGGFENVASGYSCVWCPTNSQNSGDTLNSKNSIYVEIGGVGVFYSINYERMLFQKNNCNISFNSGISCDPFMVGYSNLDNYFFLFPNAISFRIGRHSSKLEFKFNGSLLINPKFFPTNMPERLDLRKNYIYGYTYKPLCQFVFNPILSYRYEKNIFFYTLSYTPFLYRQFEKVSFGPFVKTVFFSWAGLSVGYHFKKTK